MNANHSENRLARISVFDQPPERRDDRVIISFREKLDRIERQIEFSCVRGKSFI